MFKGLEPEPGIIYVGILGAAILGQFLKFMDQFHAVSPVGEIVALRLDNRQGSGCRSGVIYEHSPPPAPWINDGERTPALRPSRRAGVFPTSLASHSSPRKARHRRRAVARYALTPVGSY